MEARLFAISLWCGLYAFALRRTMRRPAAVERPSVVMVFNALFWATFLAMVGMLISSYTERMDEWLRYSAVFGAAGLAIGALIGLRKVRDAGKRDDLLHDNLEWADTGFYAILLASIVMFFVVQAFKIPSGSMRMTFVEGDHLFVNKFIYGFPVPLSDRKVLPLREIRNADVVIFRFPSDDKESEHYGKDFIKRVVAVEGQTVRIDDKVLYVDGKRVEEPYIQTVDQEIYPPADEYPPDLFQRYWEQGLFSTVGGNFLRDNFGPVTVPKDHVFVMGDNRDRSFDSRFWGPLDEASVKGKAWLLYWPPKRIRVIR